jgi:hypothetical protein
MNTSQQDAPFVLSKRSGVASRRPMSSYDDPAPEYPGRHASAARLFSAKVLFALIFSAMVLLLAWEVSMGLGKRWMNPSGRHPAAAVHPT